MEKNFSPSENKRYQSFPEDKFFLSVFYPPKQVIIEKSCYHILSNIPIEIAKNHSQAYNILRLSFSEYKSSKHNRKYKDLILDSK